MSGCPSVLAALMSSPLLPHRCWSAAHNVNCLNACYYSWANSCLPLGDCFLNAVNVGAVALAQHLDEAASILRFQARVLQQAVSIPRAGGIPLTVSISTWQLRSCTRSPGLGCEPPNTRRATRRALRSCRCAIRFPRGVVSVHILRTPILSKDEPLIAKLHY